MINITEAYKSSNTFPSPFMQNLEELQRRIPGVGDKAIIDLINGIQVSKDIIRYRKNRGWFGNIIATLDGSDNKRQLLLDGNLIAAQEALSNWVLELTDALKISQVALEVTQNSLLEARDAIRNQKQKLQKQEDAIIQLSEQLNQLAQQVVTRINNIESRIRKLEIRVAANEDLDQIVTAWSAGQTYTKLPWAIQIALLAREVFSSSVIMYELETARGCTHAIIIHLQNGVTWNRHDFPAQTIIEIRPEKSINKSNIPMVGLIDSWLDFSSERITELKQRGYEDAKNCLIPIIQTLNILKDQRQTHHALVNSTERLLNDDPL